MDYNHLGIWFSTHLCVSESTRWRGKLLSFKDNVQPYSHSCHFLQVTYSQTLGLIGYSLLPLVIVAPIVSLLESYHWIAFFVKVRQSIHGIGYDDVELKGLYLYW